MGIIYSHQTNTGMLWNVTKSTEHVTCMRNKKYICSLNGKDQSVDEMTILEVFLGCKGVEYILTPSAEKKQKCLN
jgi:hypothetical protein